MRRSHPTSNSTLEVFLNMFCHFWIPQLRRLGSIRTLAMLSLAFVFAISSASSSFAQQSGAPPSSSAPSKLNPMNWKMPSFHMPEFLVPNDDQERIVQRKNTLVGDIKSTSSKSWQRTKAIFNPARLNPMNMFAGPTPPPGHQKKPGFFSSLLSPSTPEPEERVATVNQFLNQDRP